MPTLIRLSFLRRANNWAYQVSDKTVFRKKGKSVDFAELKLDSRVSMTFHMDGKQRVASASSDKCGWFAVLGCFLNEQAAWRWNDQIETGYVIETTMSAYPKFRPGYFCVVKGPSSHAAAADWGRIITGSYPKKAC